MSMIDDARLIDEFKKIMIGRLEEIALALPTLIPQTEEDRRLFRRGMTALNNLIQELRHANTPREISQHIDIQKVLHDFDEESIRTLSTKLSNSARASVDHLSEIARTLQDSEYGDEI